MAVFLVGASLASGSFFLKKTGAIEVRGVLGGPSPSPILVQSAEGAELAGLAAVNAGNQVALLDSAGASGGYSSAMPASAVSPKEGTLKDSGTPIGPAFSNSGVVAYTIRRGDTLSRIAANFGISVATIKSANPGIRNSTLKKGMTISILSVSEASAPAAQSEANPQLSNFNNEFMMPTNGYNWGILHHNNAVDVANSCGTPVVAAAEGLVVPDENIPNVAGGWNEGYGDFVLIEHPFGDHVRTRYAHLEQVFVKIGSYVKQGQTIGLMGETGDATGCHLHFEVIGAENPFVKK